MQDRTCRTLKITTGLVLNLFITTPSLCENINYREQTKEHEDEEGDARNINGGKLKDDERWEFSL